MISRVLMRIPVLVLVMCAAATLAAPVNQSADPSVAEDPAAVVTPATPRPVARPEATGPSPLEPALGAASASTSRLSAPSPMMALVQAAIADQRVRLSELCARLANTSDQAAALAIQKQVEALKRGTELRILQIQLDFARQAGHDAAAARLADAIADFENPVPVVTVQDQAEPPERSDRP